MKGMASGEGFEPPTPSLGNLCSIQLSYPDVRRPWPLRRHNASVDPQEGLPAVKGVRSLAGRTSWEWNGADGRDRTGDLPLTRRLLSHLSYIGEWLVDRECRFWP